MLQAFTKTRGVVAGAFSIAGIAVALLLSAPPASAQVPPVPRGVCVGSNCKSSPPSGSGGVEREVPSVPSGPSEEETRAADRKRHQQMNKFNDSGITFAEQGEWARAVVTYEEALRYCDREQHCRIIRDNLANAWSGLEWEEREAERQRRSEQVKQDIANMLDDLAEGWGATDFAGASGSLTFAGGAAVASGELEFAVPGGQSASAGLDFVAPGATLFSKPNKAVPVDVRDLEVATGDKAVPVDVRDLEVATGEAFEQGQDLRDFLHNVDWPVKVKAAFLLGVLAAESGRYDEAFNFFLDAAHAVPNLDPVIRNALQEAMSLKAEKANAASDAGHLAKGLVDPNSLAHLPPKARAGVMVAAASVNVGDYENAIRILGEAAEAAPGEQGVRDALVYVQQLKAARDELAAGFRDPALLDAARVRAQGNAAWGLGLYLAEKGDYDGAVHYLKEAREPFRDGLEREVLDEVIANVRNLGDEIPGFPVYRSKADALLDALEYGKGDWNESLRYLEVAHNADGSNLPVRDALNYLQGLSAAAPYKRGPMRRMIERVLPGGRTGYEVAY